MDATKVGLIMLSIQKIVIWLTNNILIVSILVIIVYLANFLLPSPRGWRNRSVMRASLGIEELIASDWSVKLKGRWNFSVLQCFRWHYLGILLMCLLESLEGLFCLWHRLRNNLAQNTKCKIFSKLVYWHWNGVNMCPFAYLKFWACFVIAMWLEPSLHAGDMALKGEPWLKSFRKAFQLPEGEWSHAHTADEQDSISLWAVVGTACLPRGN